MKTRKANRQYPSEHAEQSALMQWAGMMGRKHPGVDLLFAIPNGGERNERVGQKMKLEGVKRGVPDLFLPVARGQYHGLFIEMKAQSARPKRGGKGGLSDLQVGWLEALKNQGYRAVVCYGRDEAIAYIEHYLKQPSLV